MQSTLSSSGGVDPRQSSNIAWIGGWPAPGRAWTRVSPHLDEAIGYLHVTAAGRQWIVSLHGPVFFAEHAFALMGPQR